MLLDSSGGADLDGEALNDKEISFTGRFSALTQEDAARLTAREGGRVVRAPGPDTDYLVVGEQGWPLKRDGHLTASLERARQLRDDGHSISVLTEAQFLELLGERGPAGEHHLYTTAQLSRILGVSTGQIRAWVRRKLIRPVKTAHRLAFFDFRQVVGAKTLAELIESGVAPRKIRDSLEQLEGWLPEMELPLSQLRQIEQSGELLVRLEDGALAEPTGQLHLEFVDEAMNAQTSAAATAHDEQDESAEAWFERGIELEERGQLEAAEEAYQQSLFSGGPRAETAFNLGNVLYGLGRRGEARQRFLQAVEIEADYLEAWNNLGNVHAELGDHDRSVDAYRRALELEPGYADAHYNLAEALHSLGRIREAREYWRRYLQHDTMSDWARRARGRLEQTSQ